MYVAIENQVVLRMDNFLHVFIHQFWAYYVINMEYLAAVALTQEFFRGNFISNLVLVCVIDIVFFLDEYISFNSA